MTRILWMGRRERIAMIDREQVMTWLETCGKNRDCSGCCPYESNGDIPMCQEKLMDDALALLKEQEAVPVRRVNGKKNHFLKCGNCNSDMMSGFNYCPKCGKAVNWE